MQLDKSLLTTGLITLLATAGTIWLVGRLTPQGDVQLPQELVVKTCTGAVTVFVGLFAYTAFLWRRDRKRERVRVAKEMGRRICTCSETGEIFIAELAETTDTHKIEFCPRCGRKISVQIAA